ncbi:MAG: hypothetical protein AB8C84_07575 [Oligoflexales bacterium]
MKNKIVVGSVALCVVLLGVYWMQNKHHEDMLNDEASHTEASDHPVDMSLYRSKGSRSKGDTVSASKKSGVDITPSAPKTSTRKKRETTGSRQILTGDQVVDNIVKNTGLQDHLQGIEKSLEEMMEGMMELSGNMDEKELEKIKEVLGENFAAEKLLEEYRSELRSNFSDDEMAELSEVYSNEIVIEGKRLEQQANEEANKSVDEVMAFVGNLRTNPLPQERVDLLKRVDNALKTSDLASRVMSVEDGEADPTTQSMVAEGVQAQMAYTYRNMDMQALQNYAEAIEKPAAKKERNVYNNVVVNSMKKTHEGLESVSPMGEDTENTN